MKSQKAREENAFILNIKFSEIPIPTQYYTICMLNFCFKFLFQNNHFFHSLLSLLSPILSLPFQFFLLFFCIAVLLIRKWVFGCWMPVMGRDGPMLGVQMEEDGGGPSVSRTVPFSTFLLQYSGMIQNQNARDIIYAVEASGTT